MKILFAIIGLYIGAVIGEWSGAVFGFFIGILAGTLIQYSKRIKVLEEKLKQIQSGYIAANTAAAQSAFTTAADIMPRPPVFAEYVPELGRLAGIAAING